MMVRRDHTHFSHGAEASPWTSSHQELSSSRHPAGELGTWVPAFHLHRQPVAAIVWTGRQVRTSMRRGDCESVGPA